MKSKKYQLKRLIACMLLVAGTASAEEKGGDISFHGVISDVACTVDDFSQNMTVDMGNISPSALNGGTGKKASPTRFSIFLHNCPESINSAGVMFTGQVNPQNPDLLALDNTAVTADGVGIRFSDIDNNDIKLNSPGAAFAVEEGDNRLDFIARYESTKNIIVAGKADATAQFLLQYK